MVPAQNLASAAYCECTHGLREGDDRESLWSAPTLVLRLLVWSLGGSTVGLERGAAVDPGASINKSRSYSTVMCLFVQCSPRATQGLSIKARVHRLRCSAAIPEATARGEEGSPWEAHVTDMARTSVRCISSALTVGLYYGVVERQCVGVQCCASGRHGSMSPSATAIFLQRASLDPERVYIMGWEGQWQL